MFEASLLNLNRRIRELGEISSIRVSVYLYSSQVSGGRTDSSDRSGDLLAYNDVLTGFLLNFSILKSKIWKIDIETYIGLIR